MNEETLPDAPLADQVAWWQKHQKHPSFLTAGLTNPSTYSRVQSIISEGPDAWKREWKFLYEMNGPGPEASLDALPAAIAEELAAPWRENFGWSSKESPSWVIHTSCVMLGDLFRFMEAGLEEAVVAMASDENSTKPSRRGSWDRTMLYVLFSETELTSLLHRAADSRQTSWLRHRALRWLCPVAPQNEELDAWLKGCADEPDPLVKFWAAYRLATIGWIPCSPPPPAPRWVLPALRHGFSHPVLLDDYVAEDEQQRAIAVCGIDSLGIDALKETAAWLEVRPKQDALVWWPLLAFVCREQRELLESMRHHWKANLSKTTFVSLQRFLELHEAVMEAGLLLDPFTHPDAPEFDQSADLRSHDSTMRRAFSDWSSVTDLKHALGHPELCNTLREWLLTEWQRQEKHPGAERARMEQAAQMLNAPARVGDEDLAGINAAIPFAIADHLLRHPDLAKTPDYNFSHRTMTS
jgi:hypothetical protein